MPAPCPALFDAKLLLSLIVSVGEHLQNHPDQLLDESTTAEAVWALEKLFERLEVAE